MQPLRFTLEYTAPEAAIEWESGATSGRVACSLDIWAFGVVAYELLTRNRAFPSKMSDTEIWSQICGRSLLPWEQLSNGAPHHFRARAKGIVLECLHRDPAQRPTAQALVQALRSLVAE